MTGIPRSKAQRIRDRKVIADLYLRGWTQMDIAEKLKMTNAMVCRDIKTMHKVWLKSSLLDYDEAKGKELAKVDKLEFEYYSAWERSCENKETEVKKAVEALVGKRGPGTTVRKEAMKREEGQTGDPRFLAGVQWCINKRCEILGLDAPEKKDFTSGGKTLLEIEEWKRNAEKNASQIAELVED